MLPVWKGCMFSLAWHWCEWLSQLLMPRCEFYVGFSETKPLTISVHSHYFRLYFSFASYVFFFYFLSEFSTENRKLPLPPLTLSLAWCRATEVSLHSSSSCGAQVSHPWQRECYLPAPIAVIHLFPSHGTSLGQRTLLRSQADTVVSPSEQEGRLLFLRPTFYLRKQRVFLSNPCFQQERRRKKERGKRKKGRGKEKGLCMAGIWHQCLCKLAAFEAARQASECGRNGKLEGSARARLPKYFWTVWLIPALRISQILPDSRFLTVPKGPLFLRSSTFNHLQSERISPLLLTKTDIIESVLKISLAWHNIITF